MPASLSAANLKKMGTILSEANVHAPQTKEEETQLIQNIKFAQHLSTKQRMIIANLLCTNDEKEEADRLCRLEELDIDDAETLVTESSSAEESDDYESSFIDDDEKSDSSFIDDDDDEPEPKTM